MSKIAIFIAVILSVAMATQNHPLTNAQAKQLQTLLHDKKWASIVLGLAELHLMAQGPIDTLIDAINDVVDDLNRKLDRANVEYAERTQQHESEDRRLNDLILRAQNDIASTQEHINNILQPQEEQLTEDIANLNKHIEETENYITEQTAEREQQHNAFLERVQEHNDAIAAIQEAFALLDQIDGDAGLNLAQVTTLKHHFEQVQRKLQSKKNIDGALIEALLALTTGKFANSDDLQAVRDLLLKVQLNLQTSLELEGKEEENAQQEFADDMKRSKQDIQDSTAEVVEKQDQLATTQEQIQDSNDFITERNADLIQYQADLTAENESYDRATQNFNALVEQLNSELTACQEALQVVQNIELSDYIGNRLDNPSGVIDQPHGQRFGLNNNFE